jgi:hypothetical protein
MTCGTERSSLGGVRGQVVEVCVAGRRPESTGCRGSGSRWDCMSGDWLYKVLCKEGPVMVELVRYERARRCDMSRGRQSSQRYRVRHDIQKKD